MTAVELPVAALSARALAAAVLEELVDLPFLALAAWRMSRYGALEAYISDRMGDDRRPMVWDAAKHLHLELRSYALPNQPGGTLAVEAHGRYRRVPLTIWTPHYSMEAVAS